MFHLPSWGEVSSPLVGRRNRLRAMDQESSAGLQVILFSSSSFSLPWLLPPEIDRRQSKSTVIARQRSATVEIDCYRSISGGNGVETAPIGGTARYWAVRVPVSERTGTYRSNRAIVYRSWFRSPLLLLEAPPENVKAVFDAAIKVVLQPPKQKKKKKQQKGCSIL
ncbi:hypothetical protein B296_00026426 [Ensete ventricosum]|uniref:Uncharacterized protein n=1 Tax=Ensete ventricosum TaxID=4639 RepID=A0A426Z282_ENSVE|nr:hypothetical protein B296_00026426 [Ensete ventricosum]